MPEPPDIYKIKAVDDAATKKLIERAPTYGTDIPAWRLMSLDAILSGIVYKADRARVTKDLNKSLDDVYDCINYLRFVGVRLKEELERQNSQN